MPKASTFKRRLKNVGPGAIVAAAIIGPGTVTTASNVGAEFGYALIWALVFLSHSHDVSPGNGNKTWSNYS